MAANFPTGRRDASRSPARRDLPYDDGSDEGMYYRGSRDSRGYGYSRGPARHGSSGHPEYGNGRGYNGSRYSAEMYDNEYWDESHDYNGRGNTPRSEEGQYRSRRHGGRYYESRGRDDRGPRSDSRSDSRSRSPPRYRSRSRSPAPGPGTPSDTIILEGLPPGMLADEIRTSLNSSTNSQLPIMDIRIPPSRGRSPPDIKVLAEHLSGPGQRRAFVQFERVADAIAFVENYYPKIPLDLPNGINDRSDRSLQAYIHYARSRGDYDGRAVSNDTQWTCSNCQYFNRSMSSTCKSCGSRPTASSTSRPLPTGESDVGNMASQILVLYPLHPDLTEEDFAAGAKKLELEEKPAPPPRSSADAPKLKSTAPTGDTSGYGAKPGSLHRVFLMKDRETDKSLKYGFAEFWTLEDATAAHTKFRVGRSFTILGVAATVAPIHTGVFVPDPMGSTEEADRVSFSPLFNPSLRVRYWDPSIYPSWITVNSEPPATDGRANGVEEASDAKKLKKRKANTNLLPTPAKKFVPMAGQMAMWQQRSAELRGDTVSAAQESLAEANPVSDAAEPRKRLRGASTSAPKATELAATEQRPLIKISLSGLPKPGTTESAQDAAVNPERRLSPSKQVVSDQATLSSSTKPAVSYVDRDKVCCLICMMKYKSLDDLSTHERSRNHRDATEDEEKVKAALPRIAARDKRLQKKAEGQQEARDAEDTLASQYRDRAKERRETYGQPQKQKAASGNKPPRAPAEPEKPAAVPQSKGSAMLAKMGWSSGQGLGANGDGRTDIIATTAYQEGVGLGAEGGNLGDAAQLAERKTKNDYHEYVNLTQAKARERYNRLE